MLSMKKLADERNPGPTSFDKEAFVMPALRAAGTLAKAGYGAFRTGLETAARSRIGGSTFGQALRTGAGDAATAFGQQGGTALIKGNPLKLMAGAAGTTGYVGNNMISRSPQPAQQMVSHIPQPAQQMVNYASYEDGGIPIGKFLTPTQLHTIKTAGLHKVVAAVEKVASGRNVGEITIDTAVHLLGEKAFIKRAETRRITMGLAALGKVTEA